MRAFYLVLFATLVSSVVAAQVPSKVKRLDGSKSASDEITRKITDIVAAAKITGLSVAIINGDKVAYANQWGVKDTRKPDAKIDANTVMYGASFTKPLFAYGVLKMAEKGVIDLDKPLVTYLKKPLAENERFKDLAGDKNFEKVTARMILSHSSGLPILRGFYGDKLTLIAPPQTKFYYSNEGMNMLGFFIEEHTGRKLESWMDELVLVPLGMRRSGMIWRAEFEDNFAMAHDAKQEVIGAQKRTSSRAAGSMVTTADDYAKFLTALMKKQEPTKQMLKPQIDVKSDRGFGPQRDAFNNKYGKIKLSWGLGAGLFESADGKGMFHSGHTEGWQNFWIAYPDKKIALIVISNSDNFEPVAAKLLDATIGGSTAPMEWLGYFDQN